MIKKLEGWQNYLLLCVFWGIFTFGANWLFWDSEVPWSYCAFITGFGVGIYLAKWRFYDNGWHLD